MVAQFAARRVEYSTVLDFLPPRIVRKENKFRLRIDELSDQPWTSHAIDFDPFTSNPFHNHFWPGVRKRNNPANARIIPIIRVMEACSLKNKIPAMAMIAAPPAKIIGTEDSGPPF